MPQNLCTKCEFEENLETKRFVSDKITKEQATACVKCACDAQARILARFALRDRRSLPAIRACVSHQLVYTVELSAAKANKNHVIFEESTYSYQTNNFMLAILKF